MLRARALRAAMGDLTQKDFAVKHDLDASYLSQILNGHRNLGEKAARTLETKIGLPEGTLVSPGYGTLDSYPPMVVKEDGNRLYGPEVVVIPRFDIRASMGDGITVPEHLEVIQQLVVDREWIRQQRLLHSGIPNLSIITGFGDSMKGTFESGDPLLVDRGIDAISKDGIYVFTLHNMLHIKRLQRVDEHLVCVISDNKAYQHYTAELADIHIHAQVLMGLNVRRFD